MATRAGLGRIRSLFTRRAPISHNKINEIKSINDKYELLTKEFNYFKVIHNDNLDHAYQNLLKEFIITITEKNYKKDIND